MKITTIDDVIFKYLGLDFKTSGSVRDLGPSELGHGRSTQVDLEYISLILREEDITIDLKHAPLSLLEAASDALTGYME